MANVEFVRGDTTKIESTPIVDGQLLFDTDKQLIKMDNGINRQDYGGVLSTLTEEDFLENEEQYRADGKTYIVGDVDEKSNYLSASDIAFDRTHTQMTSTTVQGAIEEVKGVTDDLQKKAQLQRENGLQE